MVFLNLKPGKPSRKIKFFYNCGQAQNGAHTYKQKSIASEGLRWYNPRARRRVTHEKGLSQCIFGSNHGIRVNGYALRICERVCLHGAIMLTVPIRDRAGAHRAIRSMEGMEAWGKHAL